MSTITGQITEQTCSKCRATKPLAEFHRDKRRPTGRAHWCAECSRANSRKHFYEKHEQILAKKAAKRATPEWRAKALKNERLYAERHPERKYAQHTMNNAIRAGILKRGSCETCGTPDANGHHHDYTKPLDVEWICPACHGKEHRRFPEGKVEHVAEPPVSYNVGDPVHWYSQSKGHGKLKSGIVARIVRPGERASEIDRAGLGRRHESYVVDVNGRRYWPRTSNLKKGSGAQ